MLFYLLNTRALLSVDLQIGSYNQNKYINNSITSIIFSNIIIKINNQHYFDCIAQSIISVLKLSASLLILQ